MRRKYREAEARFEAKGYGRLATFNAERYRGLVHTPEHAAEMVALQQRFDAEHEVPSGPLFGENPA